MVFQPDGSVGLVDFNYLAGITPMPFKVEWCGGKGIHQHHRFVVTDFIRCGFSDTASGKNMVGRPEFDAAHFKVVREAETQL
jgi:hypothetical protein